MKFSRKIQLSPYLRKNCTTNHNAWAQASFGPHKFLSISSAVKLYLRFRYLLVVNKVFPVDSCENKITASVHVPREIGFSEPICKAVIDVSCGTHWLTAFPCLGLPFFHFPWLYTSVFCIERIQDFSNVYIYYMKATWGLLDFSSCFSIFGFSYLPKCCASKFCIVK